jgi:hypothetical protein
VGSEELEEVKKQIADLEAHLNTSLITERSSRKTACKILAEEVDRFSKETVAITQNTIFKLEDNQTKYVQFKALTEKKLEDLSKDMKSLAGKPTNLSQQLEN